MKNFKITSDYYFFGIVILLFFVFAYQKILFFPAHSIHSWRQADCLSLSANFMGNNNPFKPEIHNYISDDRTSGKSAGEFTGMYYIIGKIWGVFGIQIWIFRLVNYLLLIMASFSLYKVLLRYLKSIFWSLLISCFVITSPLIVYYGPNFLTDITALSFTIFGWSFFLQYLENKDNKKFYMMLFLFAIAALFKITAGVSLLSIGGILFLELIGLFDSEKAYFKKDKKFFMYFLLTLSIITSWYLYAEYYNRIHGGKYTFNSLWPIWSLDDVHFKNAIKFFTEITVYQFYHKIVLVALILLSISAFYISFIRDKRIFILLLLNFLGYTCYILFWFGALENHDYYFINLFTLPLIVLAINIYYFLLKNRDSRVKIVTQLIATFLFVLSIFYSASNIRLRYAEKLSVGAFLSESFFDENQILFWKWVSSTERDNGLFTMEKYNRKLGIKKSDLVICYPDFTFNYSLFYLNQKGWTTFNNQLYQAQPIYEMIQRGAKYLIINKKEVTNTTQDGLTEIQSFMNDSIGYYKGYTIYKLQKDFTYKTRNS
jgi:hypothetical protein